MRPPTPRETALFDSLVKHARPIILTAFNPDSCIATTRICLDVLAYFGVRGREIPLLAVLFNAEAAKMLNQGTTMAQLKEIMDALSPEDEGGPWSIGLGAGAGTGWAGHLIVGVPEMRAILDLSIDQASRPHKGLDFKPYWTILDREEWWDYDATKPNPTGDPVAPLTSEDGTAILLDRRPPDPLGYRATPNWKRRTVGDSSVYGRLTGDIIRAVRADLDGA